MPIRSDKMLPIRAGEDSARKYGAGGNFLALQLRQPEQRVELAVQVRDQRLMRERCSGDLLD